VCLLGVSGWEIIEMKLLAHENMQVDLLLALTEKAFSSIVLDRISSISPLRFPSFISNYRHDDDQNDIFIRNIFDVGRCCSIQYVSFAKCLHSVVYSV
jgi:hypothetical protein